MRTTPPIATPKPHEITAHQHTRIDPYFWLRDDERQNEEVLAYLHAENEYTDYVLGATKPLQEKLFKEIRGRIKEDDSSVPYQLGNYWYYTRYEEGKEYPIYCRKKESLDAPEEIIINENEMAEGHSFFEIGSLDVSRNHTLVAFAVDTIGRRQYVLRFKNMQTGEILSDEITGISPSVAWANDNTHIFYVKNCPKTLRSFQVFRHALGTSADSDVLVYQEDDEAYYTSLSASKTKKYIYIELSSTLSDEVHFLDANNPLGEFKCFLERSEEHKYTVADSEDKFYIGSNHEALNFKMMVCSPEDTQDMSKWVELIPHRHDVLLENFEVFENYLVLAERKNGLPHLRVWNSDTDYYIPFHDPTYSVYISTNPTFKTEKLRFSYTSPTTPSSVYEFDMKDRTTTLLKQQVVKGDFKVENYVSEYIWAEAKDGVRVPISLVYHKNTPLDGSAPLYLVGYGSYGFSYPSNFSVSRLSLLDRGFVCAIAHIRGGEEMGREWYENGKMMHKRNTFEDFIACSEYLIQQKYTTADRLFASGGSAGGLLMGAVLNLRPDLYKGVILQVPFVDVVSTMLDASIPLTTNEYDEWGNPEESEENYHYMLSYSPYDNLEAKEYPNILVITGLHDSQVQYWEPAKWVARLRSLKTDHNLLLLQTNMDAGHGGASGRFEAIKETALEYAFTLMLVGKME